MHKDKEVGRARGPAPPRRPPPSAPPPAPAPRWTAHQVSPPPPLPRTCAGRAPGGHSLVQGAGGGGGVGRGRAAGRCCPARARRIATQQHRPATPPDAGPAGRWYGSIVTTAVSGQSARAELGACLVRRSEIMIMRVLTDLWLPSCCRRVH